MNKNFDNSSHEENMKVSIDSILNVNTKMKKTRKSQDNIKRDLFISYIECMQSLLVRSEELQEIGLIDMEGYDAEFYDMAEYLLNMIFNKEQIELIHFYLYQRISPDGHVVNITDGAGNILDIGTLEQFWDLVKTIK